MTDQSESTSQAPQDDFTSDLIGATQYTFDQPKKKDFLPWHKPRKQFVREKQWAEQISSLITETPAENGMIKYLGLPGDDLLDLRHFHDKICVPNDVKLRFLGFNRGIKPGAAHKADLEVSLDEVRRLSHIDTGSQLISDDLTSIAIDRSVARVKSESMGTYDVINIDLCDGFAKQPVNNFKETHYNTLHRLMTIQARRQSPWLLFLTTRTDSDGVDGSVFGTLKDVYLQNLEDCDGFLSASGECFSVADTEQLNAYCENSAGFSNIFLTAICKWICKIGLSQNPAARVELKNVFGYKVLPSSDSPDLLSIAIKVVPTTNSAPDVVGLANQADETLNECVLASRILKRVHKQKDVDQILSANEELMQEMLLATTDLLEKARYDVSHYPQWVREAS